MKRNIFKLILIIVSLALVSTAVLYAWFTNRTQTDPINANTSGIVISYTIDDATNINPRSYSITNLSFFDCDDTSELKYFLNMACVIELKIENRTDKAITVDITQVVDTTLADTDPYAKCLFSDSLITLGTETKISDLATTYESLTGIALTAKGTTGYQTSAYVYIYGVQPDSTANNTFLADTYNFSISLFAE